MKQLTVSALLCCLPAMAAGQAPEGRAWFGTAFTGYPDVLGVSWSIPLADVSVEPGLALWVPSISLRIGYPVEVFSSSVRRVEVGAWLGARGALPVPPRFWAGPTAEIGVRSWPRAASEPVLFLTVGAWWRHSWSPTDDARYTGWYHDVDGIRPVVRLGFGKAF